MKKILQFILAILLITSLIGCGKINLDDEGPTTNAVEVYYLNDLHGAILDDGDQMGLSAIGNMILKQKSDQTKTTLTIAGGDMLQGQMLSNYFDGQPVIDLMNQIGFDCFVIGNHEFDWGLDKVLAYFDGTSHLQANFPLLGANVYYKDTNQRPDGIDPYTIINKDGFKIAIIGVIGDGLESSIAASRVADYYFADAKLEVQKQLVEVKKENPDLTIVVNHAQNSTFNNAVSKMGVNLIFNGHTHRNYVEYNNNVPVIQSGSSGQYLGRVIFNYQDSGLALYSAVNLTSYDNSSLNYPLASLDEIIDEYYQIIKPQLETVISRSDNYYSASDLTTYIAYLMATQANADVGIHNYGGTRTNLDNNEEITEAKIYQILPFDNVVVTCRLRGSDINYLLTNSSLGTYCLIDNFASDQYYTVAVNDYVFGNYNNFNASNDAQLTDIILRDLFLMAVKQQAEVYSSFSIGRPYTPVMAYLHLNNHI